MVLWTPAHANALHSAKIPSATQSSVTGLQWFKIYHDGLSGGVWAVDKLISNKGKVSFTIPSCIAPGQYLLRTELIALHGASNYPGAQLYMECAQIEITGGGNTSPPTVSFPGAYKGTDPGIKVNIYSGLTSYTIPGPSVFTCGASPGVTTVVNPPVSSTTTVPPVSTTASTGGGTVAQYGQCGGQTYTGPTGCVSPYKCTVVNAYVSFIAYRKSHPVSQFPSVQPMLMRVLAITSYLIYLIHICNMIRQRNKYSRINLAKFDIP